MSECITIEEKRTGLRNRINEGGVCVKGSIDGDSGGREMPSRVVESSQPALVREQVRDNFGAPE